MATGRNFFTTLMILCVLNMILMPKTTYSAPPHLLSRQRRVSDQRLAEIETLLGLLKMKGKLVKVPIAFGLLDPKKIGRRRRFATDDKFESLERKIRMIADYSDTFDENMLEEKILPLLVKLKEIQQNVDDKYSFI